MSGTRWIAVDWGTTKLAAALMVGPEALEVRLAPGGMAGLSQAGFEPELRALVGDWLPLPILACGMIGARQGWIEAPYARAPCPPPGLAQAKRAPGGLDVAILPGVAQDRPADVMRGEETQIAGFLLDRPQFDGVLCLPGTHTKWVRISAGEIVSFQTFMTGELFGLLSENSVLRHTIGAEGWDAPAFAESLADAMSRPATLAAQLFSLRATDLLAGLSPATARARLSGLLIGVELAGARPYWLGQDVAVIGARGLSRAYAAALREQGIAAPVHDAQEMSQAGLWAARSGG